MSCLKASGVLAEATLLANCGFIGKELVCAGEGATGLTTGAATGAGAGAEPATDVSMVRFSCILHDVSIAFCTISALGAPESCKMHDNGRKVGSRHGLH
jgi:hypothetical protein